MRDVAERLNFPFVYLYDETQTVARAYDAVCTPDFFGFDKGLGLQYRGRLDASRGTPGPSDLRRDLFLAMKQIAETGHGPQEQIPSMGCSIKWIPAACSPTRRRLFKSVCDIRYCCTAFLYKCHVA